MYKTKIIHYSSILNGLINTDKELYPKKVFRRTTEQRQRTLSSMTLLLTIRYGTKHFTGCLH